MPKIAQVPDDRAHRPETAEFDARVQANQRRHAAEIRPSYDFIVCGSGSSGSVVAARLAETGCAPVLLLMLKTPANPGGTPIEALDNIRAGVQADRSEIWKDLSLPFYGYNRPGAKVSEGCASHSGCKA